MRVAILFAVCVAGSMASEYHGIRGGNNNLIDYPFTVEVIRSPSGGINNQNHGRKINQYQQPQQQQRAFSNTNNQQYAAAKPQIQYIDIPVIVENVRQPQQQSNFQPQPQPQRNFQRQQRRFQSEQQRSVQPQQQRSFQHQQQRSFQPQQQRSFQPQQQRSFQPQQQRSFQPQQQRSFQPQQQRSFQPQQQQRFQTQQNRQPSFQIQKSEAVAAFDLPTPSNQNTRSKSRLIDYPFTVEIVSGSSGRSADYGNSNNGW